jgi:hypothetical protein
MKSDAQAMQSQCKRHAKTKIPFTVIEGKRLGREKKE